MSVRELKHTARLQEWSVRVAECRNSGISVKSWCEQRGIPCKTYYHWERQVVKVATQQFTLPAPKQDGLLMRINPDTLPNGNNDALETSITIRHGGSVISLPAGSSTKVIADLVKALNCYA